MLTDQNSLDIHRTMTTSGAAQGGPSSPSAPAASTRGFRFRSAIPCAPGTVLRAIRRKAFIAVRILDRVSLTKTLVRRGRCESFPRLASEWDFQLRVASLTSYTPAPNLMA